MGALMVSLMAFANSGPSGESRKIAVPYAVRSEIPALLASSAKVFTAASVRSLAASDSALLLAIPSPRRVELTFFVTVFHSPPSGLSATSKRTELVPISIIARLITPPYQENTLPFLLM